MSTSLWHVCSLIIQYQPDYKEQILSLLSTHSGTEIVGINEQDCKCVVLLEANDASFLYKEMESIQDIEGVLAVSLVYHQQDEQPEDFL